MKANRFLIFVSLVSVLVFGFLLNQFVVDVTEQLYSTPPKVELVQKTVEVIEDKPSYEYLCSITVEIMGIGKVENKDGDLQDASWTGTGVVVKTDDKYTYILTNAHVSGKGRQDVLLYVKDGNRRKQARIIGTHAYLDMAILKIEGKIEGKRVVKGFSVPTIQEDIYLVGHHLGRPYIYGEGVFAGYDGVYGIIQIPTLFGNSGSGVVNKDGELVALVFAINRVGYFSFDTAHGLVIDGLDVKYFLEDYGIIE